MRRWYVAYTRALAEQQVVGHLHRQGFEAYVPICRRLRRHARRAEVVTTPLFPRYVFVALDLTADRWRSVKGTYGICHLVCHGDWPAFVSDGVVAALRAREDEEGFVSLASLALFDRGARLRVLDGPFADQTGVYDRMTAAERVVLLFGLLGREVEVSVPIHAVVAA